MSAYVPIFILLFFAILFAAAVVFLSHIFGRRRVTPEKMLPYESGVDPLGNARQRFSIRFYLIAVFFILFDIETVFLYPWATLFRKLGMFGFVEMMIFILILFIGYIYIWRKGALEWV